MKKIILTSLALLAAAAAAGGAYWRRRVKPGLLIEETRYGSIQGLGTAVIQFHDDEKRMPVSLKEMVDKGYLPVESKLYADPLEVRSLGRRPIPYSQCQFELVFSSRSVTIRVPDAIARNFRDLPVPESRRSWTVGDDLAVYDPPKNR
jgi:hypothetical protein